MAIAKRSLVSNAVNEEARPLEGKPSDYDPLLKLIHEARFCLLGEATHGTHEFYRERAEITKRLIKEKGFTAVAVEADWPDAFRVNRYVRGLSDDRDAGPDRAADQRVCFVDADAGIVVAGGAEHAERERQEVARLGTSLVATE